MSTAKEEKLCQRMLKHLDLCLEWQPDLHMFFFKRIASDNAACSRIVIPQTVSNISSEIENKFRRHIRPTSLHECFHMMCSIYDIFVGRCPSPLSTADVIMPDREIIIDNPFFGKTAEEIQILLDLSGT